MRDNKMLKFIVKRVLMSIVILFFVAMIIYGIMRCMPTSFVENMARQKASRPGGGSYQEWLDKLNAIYHMDGSRLPVSLHGLDRQFREISENHGYIISLLQKNLPASSAIHLL